MAKSYKRLKIENNDTGEIFYGSERTWNILSTHVNDKYKTPTYSIVEEEKPKQKPSSKTSTTKTEDKTTAASKTETSTTKTENKNESK